jgi:hypothetical protein
MPQPSSKGEIILNTYNVHFSYYDEEKGLFDESNYPTQAENQFQARSEAWKLRNADEKASFQSCVRQIGITWDPFLGDIGQHDCFNAGIANHIYRMNQSKYIDYPNGHIKLNAEIIGASESHISLIADYLDTINASMRDVGEAFKITPPYVFDEIEYAKRMIKEIDNTGQHEVMAALLNTTTNAQKWHPEAMQNLKDLFDTGCLNTQNNHIDLKRYMTQDSLFPLLADAADDNMENYYSRWRKDSVLKIDKFFSSSSIKDFCVIKNSNLHMAYEGKALILNPESLTSSDRYTNNHFENIFWRRQENKPDDHSVEFDPKSRFIARNLVTDEIKEFSRDQFVGVLRPEYVKYIDFDQLRDIYRVDGHLSNDLFIKNLKNNYFEYFMETANSFDELDAWTHDDYGNESDNEWDNEF